MFSPITRYLLHTRQPEFVVEAEKTSETVEKTTSLEFSNPTPLYNPLDEESQKEWILALLKDGHTNCVVECCAQETLFEPLFYLKILQRIYLYSFSDTVRILIILKKRKVLEKIDPPLLFQNFTSILSHIFKNPQNSAPLLILVSKELTQLIDHIDFQKETAEKKRIIRKMFFWLTRQLVQSHEARLADLLLNKAAFKILDPQSQAFISAWLNVIDSLLMQSLSTEEMQNHLDQAKNFRKTTKLPKLLVRFIRIEQTLSDKLVAEQKDPHKGQRNFKKLLTERDFPIDLDLFTSLSALLQDPLLWDEAALNFVIKCIHCLPVKLHQKTKETIVKLLPLLFQALIEQKSNEAVSCAIALHARSIPVEATLINQTFWLWLVKRSLKDPRLNQLLNIAKKYQFVDKLPQAYASAELSLAKQWFMSSSSEGKGAQLIEDLLSSKHLSEADQKELVQLFWLVLDYFENQKNYIKALKLIDLVLLFDPTLLNELLPRYVELLTTAYKSCNKSRFSEILKGSDLVLNEEVQNLQEISHLLHETANHLMQEIRQPQITPKHAKIKVEKLAEVMLHTPKVFSKEQWENLFALLIAFPPANLSKLLIAMRNLAVTRNFQKESYTLIGLAIKQLDLENRHELLLELLEFKPFLPIEEGVFLTYMEVFYQLVEKGSKSLIHIVKEKIDIKKILNTLHYHLNLLQQKFKDQLEECSSEHVAYIETLDKLDALQIQLVQITREKGRNNAWSFQLIKKSIELFSSSSHSLATWENSAPLCHVLLHLYRVSKDDEIENIIFKLMPFLKLIEKVDYHSLIHSILSFEKTISFTQIAKIFINNYKNCCEFDLKTLFLLQSLIEEAIRLKLVAEGEELLQLFYQKIILIPVAEVPESFSTYYLLKCQCLRIKSHAKKNLSYSALLTTIFSNFTHLEKTPQLESLVETLSLLIFDLAQEDYSIFIEQSAHFCRCISVIKSKIFAKKMLLDFLHKLITAPFGSHDLTVWVCFLARNLFLKGSLFKKEVLSLIAAQSETPILIERSILDGITSPIYEYPFFDDLLLMNQHFDEKTFSPTQNLEIARFLKNAEKYLRPTPSLFLHFFYGFLTYFWKNTPKELLGNMTDLFCSNRLLLYEMKEEKEDDCRTANILTLTYSYLFLLLYRQLQNSIDKKLPTHQLEEALLLHVQQSIQKKIYIAKAEKLFIMIYHLTPYFAKTHLRKQLIRNIEEATIPNLLYMIREMLKEKAIDPYISCHFLVCKTIWLRNLHENFDTHEYLSKKLKTKQERETYKSILKKLKNSDSSNLL